ncbi:MAG: hypothetical protein AMJ54_11950 [Deltaproteobacteria bacterium SG8_13]|nr:MAG: hypothetical protein AMJ54_11950 [Deltaproteobacteria bacterium SG8_13]
MKIGVAVLFLLVLVGCAGTSKYMQDVTDPNIAYAPAVDEVIVVFMRPSTFAFAIQSGLFDITTEKNDVIGIVSAKKKLAYRTTPGKHLFMVTGESADFLQADLQAGKTYYALITPRMGAWKARFSLAAVSKDIEPDKLNEWKTACTWVETSEATRQWAKENAGSIQRKRSDYIAKWMAKPEEGKPTLAPEDGF